MVDADSRERRLATRHIRNLPMLMISGYDRDASGQQQRDPGVLFLGKPFTLLALAQYCRAALEGVPLA